MKIKNWMFTEESKMKKLLLTMHYLSWHLL